MVFFSFFCILKGKYNYYVFNMNRQTIRWFTLVEMMIVISVIFIIGLTVYAPYNHFANVAKLKQSVKEISQSLYEARNMAINWTEWTNGNTSIWLYIHDNIMTYYSYPYGIDPLNISIEDRVMGINTTSETHILKEYTIQPGVTIEPIEWQDNILFYFSAIEGVVNYYYFDSTWRHDIDLTANPEEIITIEVSYKGSTSSIMRKELQYLTKTNIIDY